jgi:hypothetical protein
MLSADLCECETLCLTLKKEYDNEFRSRMLRVILETKREEITRSYRKSHNTGLQNL